MAWQSIPSIEVRPLIMVQHTIQINTWCEKVEDELQSMEKGKLIRIFALSRNMADRPEGTRQHFGDRGG